LILSHIESAAARVRWASYWAIHCNHVLWTRPHVPRICSALKNVGCILQKLWFCSNAQRICSSKRTCLGLVYPRLLAQSFMLALYQCSNDQTHRMQIEKAPEAGRMLIVNGASSRKDDGAFCQSKSQASSTKVLRRPVAAATGRLSAYRQG
jgi:hypothetical protein